jgi:hypothetical protein
MEFSDSSLVLGLRLRFQRGYQVQVTCLISKTFECKAQVFEIKIIDSMHLITLSRFINQNLILNLSKRAHPHTSLISLYYPNHIASYKTSLLSTI